MAEPEHIKKYKRLKKKADKIIDTTNIHHTGAFTTAAEEVLKDESGLIDYSLLKKPEYQSKFSDKMANYYIDKAEKTFKIKIKERDELEKEMLMKAYSGVTKAELKNAIRQYRNRFTLGFFEEKVKPKFMESITETLSEVPLQHFEDKHIDDIVKYMNIGHMVDTKYMKLRDALYLLNEIHEKVGAVTEKHLEDQLYYKKKKK